MNYSLSTAVIRDTIHAFAALELLSLPEKGRALLAPFLGDIPPGPLSLMIKNAFAETVLELLPYVIDTNLDDESAESNPEHHLADCADALMKIELRVPAGRVPDNFHGVVRRHLEMSIVWRVIESRLLVSGVDGATALASAMAVKLRDNMSSLNMLLNQPSRPFVRRAFY